MDWEILYEFFVQFLAGVCNIRRTILCLLVGVVGCRSPFTAELPINNPPSEKFWKTSLTPHQSAIPLPKHTQVALIPITQTNAVQGPDGELPNWTFLQSNISPFDDQSSPSVWLFDKRSTQFELGDLNADPDAPSNRIRLVERLWSDQLNFYSPESLTLLGGGLIAGAAVANTRLDEGIQRHFQSSVRGATSDDWFESLHASKELGNGRYTLPVFASAWALGELMPENEYLQTSSRWGARSIRAFAVGAPPLILMQQLTGGSRPNETDEDSEWHPFRDNNGISGHAFMGSLPFITAAKMTENRGLKALYYAGSTIAPLSRVNDNAHYPSQVALGWWMAYLAASAIDATENPNSRWKFYPYTTGDSSGLRAEIRY